MHKKCVSGLRFLGSRCIPPTENSVPQNSPCPISSPGPHLHQAGDGDRCEAPAVHRSDRGHRSYPLLLIDRVLIPSCAPTWYGAYSTLSGRPADCGLSGRRDTSRYSVRSELYEERVIAFLGRVRRDFPQP